MQFFPRTARWCQRATISCEEIFGQILPVYVYDTIQEVVDYLQERPTPLGSYRYGEDMASTPSPVT